MMDPDDKRDGPPKNTVQIMRPNEITPEQVKIYKDCMFDMMLKVGIPYATIAHFLAFTLAKRDAQQQPTPLQQPTPVPGSFVKKAFFFFANMLVGTFFVSPRCYMKLAEKYESEKRKTVQVPVAPVTERTPTTRPTDDYSYPLDLSSNLSNEAESTFTSELSPSKILADEDEVTKITPSTTYQDLRNKHRSSYLRRYESPPPEDSKRSPYKTPDENVSESEPSSTKKEPKKIVRRNKYGDEIE